MEKNEKREKEMHKNEEIIVLLSFIVTLLNRKL